MSPIYTGERKRLVPSVREYALLEEFSFVRREAQAEADQAYHHWHAQPSKDTYAVYRAAQDRADAAQDDLADWSQALAA
jgi:hypothetical protein